jgi:hypothetical protein
MTACQSEYFKKNLDNQEIKAMNVMPIAQGKAKQTPGY